MTGLFQKIFGKSKLSKQGARQEGEIDQTTQPISLVSAPTVKTPSSQKKTSQPPQILAAAGHSVGMQRDQNEDALFTLTTTLVSDTTSIPFGLYIVADGMGGHEHGEKASGIAVRAMAGYLIRKIYAPLFDLSPGTSDQSLQEIMQEGIQTAHRAILKQAPGGGTTLTGVLILGDQMTIAHVGDSRAYAIHADGRIELMTRDHSLVKRLVELGQITNDEAATHPQRNVLYRALGQGEPFDAELTTTPLPKSAHLLICSDGLWGSISEIEIVELVTSSGTLDQICQQLVAAANAAGGPDNITAILLRLPG